MFYRPLVYKGGNTLAQGLRGKSVPIVNVLPHVHTADTTLNLTVDMLVSGVLYQQGLLTATVIYNLPPTADILDAFEGMNIGESFSFFIVNAQNNAFQVRLDVKVGVTAIGNRFTDRNSSRLFTLVKTSETTMDLY